MASTLSDRLSRLVKTMRGQARITEIVAELDVTSVTGSMKQLEKLGYAYRSGAEHDHRAIYASITQQGRDEIARCIKSASA